MMEMEQAAKGDADGAAGSSSSERYFCPYPNCKRSFAELWRLKVHYRAPPDIRGSGKERGHGTELTHCPKCGKGLKPGKHHVGCSGGKAGPRQNKRSRLVGSNAPAMGMEGVPANMYNLQLQYGQTGTMPNGFTPQLGAGFQQQQQQQQQYLAQQYQSDMTGGMYAGQMAAAQGMAGSLPQQQGQVQQQQQQQSPALSMGIIPDQLTNGTAMGTTVAGAADGGLVPAAQGFYQQQQPMQQQMSLDSSTGLSSMQSLQTTQLQDGLSVHQGFGMTASAAFMNQQQQQQQQQGQQLQDVNMYAAPDAGAAATATAGMMPPPQQVQMAPMAHQQLVQMQPQQQQQQSPQLIPAVQAAAVSVSTPHMSVQLTSAGSGTLLQQQQPQLVTTMMQPQGLQQQQLMSATAMQQQQPQLQQQVMANAQGVMAPATVSAAPSMQQLPGAVPQQLMQQQQQPMQEAQPGMLHTSMQPPPPVQQMPPPPPQQPQQQQHMPQQHQINSNLFDEIDGLTDMGPAPSPPPLPADFPAASGTLFNFSQFQHKLPAAGGPTQQMAMMPRGMEQELPPSMDELWTPEATYDHHSDGDLMQLLFGAPEQPPTMATIHLHHFLDDDACSSPGLLAGILGGSMDDLNAAGAGAEAGGASGAVAADGGGQLKPDAASSEAALLPTMPTQGQQLQLQEANLVPSTVKAEPQLTDMTAVQQPQPQQQQQPELISSGQPYQHNTCQQPQAMLQQQHQQLFSAMPMPLNGLNGLNGINCSAPAAAMLPNGQCASAALQVHMSLQLNVQQQELAAVAGGPGGTSSMVGIKGEDDALLMQQKAAVAAATLPGAMASRAN